MTRGSRDQFSEFWGPGAREEGGGWGPGDGPSRLFQLLVAPQSSACGRESLMSASSLSFLHTTVPVSTLLPLTDASAVGSVPHPMSSSHPGTSTKTLCPNEVASQMPGVSSTSVSEGGNSARDAPSPPLFTSAPTPAPQLLLCSPVPGGGRSEVRQWSARARLRREVLSPTAASSHPHRVHDEAAEAGGGDGPRPRSQCQLRGNSKVGAGSHTSPPHP